VSMYMDIHIRTELQPGIFIYTGLYTDALHVHLGL